MSSPRPIGVESEVSIECEEGEAASNVISLKASQLCNTTSQFHYITSQLDGACSKASMPVSLQDENDIKEQSPSPKRPRATSLHPEPQSPALSHMRAPLYDVDRNKRSLQSPPRPTGRRTHTGMSSPQSPPRAIQAVDAAIVAHSPQPYPPLAHDAANYTHAVITNGQPFQAHRFLNWSENQKRVPVSPRNRSFTSDCSASLTGEEVFTPGAGNATRFSSAPSDVDSIPSASVTSLNPERPAPGTSLIPGASVIVQMPETTLQVRHPRMTNRFGSPQRAHNGNNALALQPPLTATWSPLTAIPTALPAQLQSRYQLCEDNGALLGTGAFAQVVKIRELSGIPNTGKIFALKVLQKEAITCRQLEAQVMRELEFQRIYKHPNIVSFHEKSFEADDHYWMVMEFAARGTLLAHRRNIDFALLASPGSLQARDHFASFYMRQICEAMVYLHSEKVNIVHRDIKADNILLFSPEVAKLSDFGWSCKMSTNMSDEEIPKNRAGTSTHSAPEVWNSQWHGCPADCWSFGVTVYEVLYPGVACFDDEESRTSGKYTDPQSRMVGIMGTVTKDAQDLFKKLFVYKDFRLSAQQILDHPWLRNAPQACPSVQPPLCVPGPAAIAAGCQRNASLGSLHVQPPVAASSHAPRANCVSNLHARESPRSSNCFPIGTRHAVPQHEVAAHRHSAVATYGVMSNMAGGQEQSKAKAPLPTVPKVPVQQTVFRTETPARNVNAARHSTASQVTAPMTLTKAPPARSVAKAAPTGPTPGLQPAPNLSSQPRRTVNGTVTRTIGQRA